MVRKLGVDALPAVVGWLAKGEKQVLSTGISVKDIKSAIRDLSALLDGFEKKNNKAAAASARRKKTENETGEDKRLPVLTRSNFDDICSERVPVCIIGAFRSSKGRGHLETILSSVSNTLLYLNREEITHIYIHYLTLVELFKCHQVV